MCRRNFRVKVDLSKFYDDVRRSSWIYVDKGSISCICHLQEHIAQVFDLQRPIHLLLDSGEYLPPNEDSRILKEDETILVVPGTGLENNHSNPARAASDSQVDTSCVVSQQKQCVSDPIITPEVKKTESSEEEEEAASLIESTNGNTIFFSMINDSQMESASESKPEVSVLEESEDLDASSIKNKRKRIRRKKSKNVSPSEQQPVANNSCGDDIEYKKPKIINSVTIPNGKHIRFGDVEKLEFHGYDSSASNDSKKHDSKAGKNGIEDSYWDKPMTGSNLSNLLALRQSSTPITFGRKKTEEKINRGNPETLEVKETVAEEKLLSKKDSHAVKVDPKKHPLMESKARLYDVIAFKMLKIASDYTPQVSEYIIAQPIQISADKLTYMFKIIVGKEEVQAPQGKFDIETDETQDTETDLISLNWPQLIEPRLIFRE